MKKCFLILFFFCFAFTNITIAQKTPVKKTAPKKIQPPKIYNVPPPPKVEKPVTNAPRPVPSYPQASSPMVMESSEDSKFRKERICSDCDTLRLAPNKAHIVIYDVKWMSDNQSRTYRNQPTEDDLSKDYYALRGENKREWEELKQNFPEDGFEYHHVYRNTFIQIPNQKQETLSLLDRQESHEGFLYWSGKGTDNAINRKEMAMLTETVAKARGKNKVSSYYQAFLKDSSAIANYQKTVSPSSNLMPNMNVLLQKELFGETVIPFQFLNFNKVSKITTKFTSEKDARISFALNNKGQLTTITEGKRDSTVITYKDNLPHGARRGNQILNFYYRGDTVIVKENNDLQVYSLVGSVFIPVKRYNISKEDYAKMTLTDGYETTMNSNTTKTCVTATEEENRRSSSTCYSNTNWTLPLNVVIKDIGENSVFESKISYSKPTENNLIIEDVNNAKSTKLEYVLANGKLVKITNLTKRGQGEFGEPHILEVSYEYFK